MCLVSSPSILPTTRFYMTLRGVLCLLDDLRFYLRALFLLFLQSTSYSRAVVIVFSAFSLSTFFAGQLNRERFRA